MEFVAVTLSSKVFNQPKDLLLPLDVPQYHLTDALIDLLDLKLPNKSKGFLALCDGKMKKPLPIQATLRDVGVKFGQFLELELRTASASASLICLQGPEFELEKDEVVIGCKTGVDIDLRTIRNQEFVSGLHAKIFSRNNDYYCTDMKSLNGTSVNGYSVKPGEEFLLKDGDVLLLGTQREHGIQLVFKLRN